jgi:hypothetical protein
MRKKRADTSTPEAREWRAHLSAQELVELDATHDDHREWHRLGLRQPAKQTEYTAVPDPTGERAARLEQLRAAAATYQRLRLRGMKRAREAQQSTPVAARWRPYLTEQERAELDAVQDDLNEWMRLGLKKAGKQAEYKAAPNPTGERAAKFERLRRAVQTYSRLFYRANTRRKRGGAIEPKRAGVGRLQKQKQLEWRAYLTEQERTTLGAVDKAAKQWYSQGLDKRKAREAYEAAPDPTGERMATLKRLHAAATAVTQLRRRARRRQARQKRRLHPRPSEFYWIAYLNEPESAELDAAHAGVKEWQGRMLDEPEALEEYLAMPDPTGERRATVNSLRAAVDAERRLRSKAMRCRHRVMTGQPPEAKTEAWLYHLTEQERSQLEAVQHDTSIWREQRLHEPAV